MQKILLLSDIHMGSYWGPIPEDTRFRDPRTGDMITVEPASINKFLYNHWKEMVRTSKDVDCIIFNGDLIDGINHNNHGAVFTDDPYVQVKLASEMISELAYDVPMYFTKGTGYHAGNEIKAERIIADDLGGVYGDELIIEECGLRIFANHFISPTVNLQNRTTPISSKLMQLALNSADDKYGHIDVAVFSHTHYFAASTFHSQIGINTPCWQGKTPYAAEKNLVSVPDIGWVTLHVHDPQCIAVDRRGITHTPNPCQVVGGNTYAR
jgi:predicted phosphodiesterase